MSNFLLKDPSCVLIHIPKTGGSSIRRGLWESNYEGPAFGVIPQDWAGYFKFAFVRHPLDRLVSAWADFNQLRGFKGPIEEFLRVVADDTVLYDERRATMSERIRHHTIPQTHPFNCLSYADYVGRYENYFDDLDFVLRKVGMPARSLPKLRATAHGNWQMHLSGAALRQAVEFYDEDFESLAYPRP